VDKTGTTSIYHWKYASPHHCKSTVNQAHCRSCIPESFVKSSTRLRRPAHVSTRPWSILSAALFRRNQVGQAAWT
jgi:hypothetical protein